MFDISPILIVEKNIENMTIKTFLASTPLSLTKYDERWKRTEISTNIKLSPSPYKNPDKIALFLLLF